MDSEAAEQQPVIVPTDWTNAPIESILFKQIILLHETNINLKKERQEHATLVQRLETIIQADQSGAIAKHIFDKLVFTAAAIPRNDNIPKSSVYRTVKDLEMLRVVEKTRFKAVNPDPGYTGPKARFYKIRGYDLSQGWDDPRLKEAQLDYAASFLSSPEHIIRRSNQDRLLSISLELRDYYESRGTRLISYDNIISRLKGHYPDIEPRDRPKIAKLFFKKRKEVEADG